MDKHQRASQPGLRGATQLHELEQIFDTVTEGIGLIDRSGHIRRINRPAEHFGKGLVKPGMTLLKAWRLLKTRTEEGTLITNTKQLPTYPVFVRGETVTGVVLKMQLPVSHKQRYVSCTAAPIRNEKGQVSAAVLHLTDITEQKEAETQIEAFTVLLSEKIAQQTMETQEFIYGITHDLKAPIVTLQGFLRQILKKHSGSLPEDACKQLSILQQASDRLWQMVDGLLCFAQIHEASDTSTQTAMNPILHKVRLDQSHEINACAAQIKIDRLPKAYISETQAYQIWANLLNNAIRYRHPQRPLKIHLGYDAQQTAYFIQDNGIGIDPKYHQTIFNIFTRLNTHPHSTGIGLTHVKKIVEETGGQIWLKSSAGRGTCFYFTLSPEV